MRILEIEGIGEVEVDDSFAALSPQEQADEVDEIVDMIRSGQAGAAGPAIGQSNPNFIGVLDAELSIAAQAASGAPQVASPPTAQTATPALTTADIANQAQRAGETIGVPDAQLGISPAEANVSPLAQLREKSLGDLAIENVTFGTGSDVTAGGFAIGDVVSGVVQGRFSFGDIVDGIASFPGSLVGMDTTALGRAFQRRKAEEKAAFDRVRQREGGLATAAEIGGAILSAPVSGVGRGIRAATEFGPRLAQAAKEGAVFGGLAGVGFSEGETLQERATGAAGGATLGAAGGVVLTAAGTAARAAFNGIVAPLTITVFRKATDTPFRAAVRNITTKLREEDITPERAVARVLRAVQTRSGIRLGDQGRQVQELLDTVGNVPGGTARATVNRALDTRQAARPERIQRELDVALGDSAMFSNAINARIQNRSELADVLYQLAFRIQVPFTRTLEMLTQRPSMRAALRDAVRKGQEEGVVGGLFGRFVQVADDGTTTVTRVPDMASWDRVKRALREREDVLRARGRKDDARLVGDTRRTLTAELDKHNPTYGLARQIFEGESELLDAARLGAEVVFSRGSARRQFNIAPGAGRPTEPGGAAFNLDDALEQVRGMTRGEREMARLGAARALRAEIDTIATQADLQASTRFVKQMFGTPATQRVLRELIGNDTAFRRLRQSMLLEARGIQTEALRRNSRTAQRQANAAELASEGIDALGQVVRGNVAALVQRALGRLFGEQIHPRVAAEMAEILTTRNPRLLMRFLGESQRQSGRQATGTRRIPGAVAAPAAAVRGGAQVSGADVLATEVLPQVSFGSLAPGANGDRR